MRAARALLALALAGAACDGSPGPQPPQAVSLDAPARVPVTWTGLAPQAVWAGDERIAVATDDGTVHRVHAAGTEPAARLATLDSTPDLAADPASGVVVAMSTFGQLRVWDGRGGELSRRDVDQADLGELAVEAGGARYAVAGHRVAVVDAKSGAVLQRADRPPDGRLAYRSLVFTGDRIVAAPGPDNAVDRWDLASGTPRLTSQPCGCEAVASATVLDPAGRFAAIGTQTGKIVLWNVDQGRAEAEQTLITAADQAAVPYAVVDDRFVLYSVQSSQPDPARLAGPLSVWDTHSRTTAELWTCPDGCEVRTVTRLPGTDRLLIYAADPGGNDPSLWTATLRHP